MQISALGVLRELREHRPASSISAIDKCNCHLSARRERTCVLRNPRHPAVARRSFTSPLFRRGEGGGGGGGGGERDGAHSGTRRSEINRRKRKYLPVGRTCRRYFCRARRRARWCGLRIEKSRLSTRGTAGIRKSCPTFRCIRRETFRHEICQTRQRERSSSSGCQTSRAGDWPWPCPPPPPPTRVYIRF